MATSGGSKGGRAKGRWDVGEGVEADAEPVGEPDIQAEAEPDGEPETDPEMAPGAEWGGASGWADA